MSQVIKLETEIKRGLLVFMIVLVLSGITAFPIESQLEIAHDAIQYFQVDNEITKWIERVYEGVRETNARFPFISYGTDWLAFAHLMIAIAFIGPYRDPVRNVWVIEFGLIACIAILPLAFIAGYIRGIPLYWSFLDCSFGIIGGLLLWWIYEKIGRLEVEKSLKQNQVYEIV